MVGKNFDQCIQNCHVGKQVLSLYHVACRVVRLLAIPVKSWKDISIGYVLGQTEYDRYDAI